VIWCEINSEYKIYLFACLINPERSTSGWKKRKNKLKGRGKFSKAKTTIQKMLNWKILTKNFV